MTVLILWILLADYLGAGFLVYYIKNKYSTEKQPFDWKLILTWPKEII